MKDFFSSIDNNAYRYKKKALKLINMKLKILYIFYIIKLVLCYDLNFSLVCYILNLNKTKCLSFIPPYFNPRVLSQIFTVRYVNLVIIVLPLIKYTMKFLINDMTTYIIYYNIFNTIILNHSNLCFHCCYNIIHI